VEAVEVLPWPQTVAEKMALVETVPLAAEQLLEEAAMGSVTPTSREKAAVAGAGSPAVERISS
jgi:hypothetical protein